MIPLIEVLPAKKESQRRLARLHNFRHCTRTTTVGRFRIVYDRIAVERIQLDHLGYLNLLQGMDIRTLLSHEWKADRPMISFGAFFLLGCNRQSGNGDYPHRIDGAVGARIYRPSQEGFTLTPPQLSNLLSRILQEGFSDVQ